MLRSFQTQIEFQHLWVTTHKVGQNIYRSNIWKSRTKIKPHGESAGAPNRSATVDGSGAPSFVFGVWSRSCILFHGIVSAPPRSRESVKDLQRQCVKDVMQLNTLAFGDRRSLQTLNCRIQITTVPIRPEMRPCQKQPFSPSTESPPPIRRKPTLKPPIEINFAFTPKLCRSFPIYGAHCLYGSRKRPEARKGMGAGPSPLPLFAPSQ